MLGSRYISRLTGCNIILTLIVGVTAASAGCNSGNVAQTTLITGAGCLASAPGALALAVGADALAGGGESVALGYYSTATGFRSIGIGASSDSTNFGTSVGFNTFTEFASTAVGTDSKARGERSIAIGRFATTTATSAVAIGESAEAKRLDSVALGSGSVANNPNTVSVGSRTQKRRIVNAAPAIRGSDVTTLAQVNNIAAAAVQAVAAELAELRALVKKQEAELAALRLVQRD